MLAGLLDHLADAKARTYFQVAPNTATFPFCVVMGPISSTDRRGMGSFINGTLEVHITDRVEQADDQDAAIEFTNSVGGVLKDIWDESLSPGRLLLSSTDQSIGFVRSDLNEANDLY
ncbi:hypothetical protein Pan216_12740 [Planctomycetes bacterium Pan216]|uniref:Uncharacterized protein n=1 Tax=Kolteria novifilia TaxID=2527975 RepID=A0A518B0E2_9BACT|nr:hypothetical protein Pan216_12740 [Planctomycetes bacterium Pan216]